MKYPNLELLPHPGTNKKLEHIRIEMQSILRQRHFIERYLKAVNYYEDTISPITDRAYTVKLCIIFKHYEISRS